jgi:hypothetical protein
MARIIVITEETERPSAPRLLDERVCPQHLSDSHSAAQLVERLRWAIDDAEDAERQARIVIR